MKNTVIIAMILVSFGLVSCTDSTPNNIEKTPENTNIEANVVNEQGVDEEMVDEVVGELFKDIK